MVIVIAEVYKHALYQGFFPTALYANILCFMILFHEHYFNKLALMFAIIVLSLIITIVAPTITFVFASSPATYYMNSSLSQKDIPDDSKSTFKITDNLKNLLKDIVDNNKTHAAFVVGLVDLNGTQFYGYGNMSKANNTTVDKNTIFAIGSNTKVFTTMLLADMVEDGLINLDDPIEKYLPFNITVPQYKGHKITIEDLATHTSGLPEFPPNFCTSFQMANPQTPSDIIQTRLNLMNCPKNYTFDQFYQGLSNTTISREPGTKVEYSTFGSALLGNILVSKSNMSSYEELLKKRILSVVGMNDTSINISEAQKSRLAIGHLNGQELPLLNVSNPIVPGGGLYSSASDMLKFLSANIGLIKTKLDKPMQESHLILHDTGQTIPNNKKVSNQNMTDSSGFYIGLGWFVTTDFGNEIIWHNGATVGGYNAFMGFNPATDRGIVILCSSDKDNADIIIAGLYNNNALSTSVWNLLKG
jgi:serine-type D-Ala-D-Ala carboxypeptidase/endopeptidase